MARKINETSTRQLAFKRLDTMTSLGRKEAATALTKEFDIKMPYAMTIYQQHRNEQKKNGKYTPVFVVRDIKDNKSVSPFVSTTHVLNPAKDDAVTPEDAVSKYCVKQNTKILQAKDMKLPVITPPETSAELSADATAETTTEDETPQQSVEISGEVTGSDDESITLAVK